jgi:hypothetical protein
MFLRRETPGYRGTVPGIFFVFCLSGPSGAQLLLFLQFAHCQAVLQFRIRLRCDKAGKQDGEAGNNFAEKTSFQFDWNRGSVL